MGGTEPIAGRVTAKSETVVVFLIGMRVNRWRAVRHWLPTLLAMPRMLKELAGDEGSGLLALRRLGGGPREFGTVQYWESREKLLAYASAAGREHRPAWAAFNRRARGGGGAVGIWHETFDVPAGSVESVYNAMPEAGLGTAFGTEPVGRRGERAAERLAYGAAEAGEAARP